MKHGSKDIAGYMNMSDTDAPNDLQGNEAEEVRIRVGAREYLKGGKRIATGKRGPGEAAEKAQGAKTKRGIDWRITDQGGQRSKDLSAGHRVYLQGTRAGRQYGGYQEAQMLFELILNILLFDGPITTQTLITNAQTSAYARHDGFGGKGPMRHGRLRVELEPGTWYDTPAVKQNYHWRDYRSGFPPPLPCNVRIAEGSMELWQGPCRPKSSKHLVNVTSIWGGLQ
jgi:hypothetical protein